MTPRHWDHAKLNALLEKMHARVSSVEVRYQ